MELADLIDGLRYHASLQSEGGHAPSLGDVIADKGNLDDSLNEVLDLLGRLNLQLNGRTPSAGTSKEPNIPRTLVYAVTEIGNLLRTAMLRARSDGDGKTLFRAAWAVDTAWSAVLAGDIDGLREHIALEEHTLGD